MTSRPAWAGTTTWLIPGREPGKGWRLPVGNAAWSFVSAVGRDNVQDQNWPCELDHELLMVSPDSDRDDEDVDHHCENTQQGGKTFGSSTEIGLNEIGEKSF